MTGGGTAFICQNEHTDRMCSNQLVRQYRKRVLQPACLANAEHHRVAVAAESPSRPFGKLGEIVQEGGFQRGFAFQFLGERWCWLPYQSRCGEPDQKEKGASHCRRVAASELNRYTGNRGAGDLRGRRAGWPEILEFDMIAAVEVLPDQLKEHPVGCLPA